MFSVFVIIIKGLVSKTTYICIKKINIWLIFGISFDLWSKHKYIGYKIVFNYTYDVHNVRKKNVIVSFEKQRTFGEKIRYYCPSLSISKILSMKKKPYQDAPRLSLFLVLSKKASAND